MTINSNDSMNSSSSDNNNTPIQLDSINEKINDTLFSLTQNMHQKNVLLSKQVAKNENTHLAESLASTQAELTTVTEQLKSERLSSQTHIQSLQRQLSSSTNALQSKESASLQEEIAALTRRVEELVFGAVTIASSDVPPNYVQRKRAETMKLPSVRIETATKSVNAASNLPDGVIMTGGQKLRDDGLTGEGIRVAVIDGGIDINHAGFEGKVTNQKIYRGGALGQHGTHVAGTIHMMAPDAEIWDYRVFGDGGWPIDEAIVDSIYNAVFEKCHVINMSLGGPHPSSNILTAIKFAISKGVVVVVAAGNEGDGNPLTNERSFPGVWDECISIAAVSKENNQLVAEFSNTNPEVDYAGIGTDVTSFKAGGGYMTMSGTSMACPHVAGLIAALLSGDADFKSDFTKNNSKGNSTFGKKKKVHRNVRKLLNDKFIVDVGEVGRDNGSGLGFLTYLGKKEFKV